VPPEEEQYKWDKAEKIMTDGRRTVGRDITGRQTASAKFCGERRRERMFSAQGENLRGKTTRHVGEETPGTNKQKYSDHLAGVSPT
jgi:hypothetical protein